jgi:hypothetical protein
MFSSLDIPPPGCAQLTQTKGRFAGEFMRRLLIAFLLFAAPVTSVIAQEDTGSTDPKAFLIPRERLSTQISDPFKLVGRVMDESQPRWDEFEDTLASFPTTSSCLLPEEREKEVQNLLAFDWKAMRYLTEIDICVWRIATTLNDINLMRDWLALQGFAGSYDTQSCDNAVRTPITSLRTQFCGISGVMSIEDIDEETSLYDNMSFLTRWFWRGVSRRAGITVSYNYNMQVNDVSFGVISQ